MRLAAVLRMRSVLEQIAGRAYLERYASEGERDAFVEAFRTEDSQIGVKSFLENGPGKAEFTGR